MITLKKDKSTNDIYQKQENMTTPGQKNDEAIDEDMSNSNSSKISEDSLSNNKSLFGIGASLILLIEFLKTVFSSFTCCWNSEKLFILSL